MTALPKDSRLAAGDPDAELAATFDRDGFVIFDPEIEPAMIESALTEVRDRFVETRVPYYADATRIIDAWQFSPSVRHIATAPRVTRLLRKLYGRRPIPFQTLNFRVGSEQKTHSDTIHFESYPHGFMCGVWVALEDVDERNGPLHYFPTSQSLPIYSIQDLGIEPGLPDDFYRNYDQYETKVETLMRESALDRAILSLERGQALIWAANLFHGGDPIRERTRTRMSQVTHFFFEDCLYYTPLISDWDNGRVWLRVVHDITTGRDVAHRYGERRFRPPAPGYADLGAPDNLPNRGLPPLRERFADLVTRARQTFRR